MNDFEDRLASALRSAGEDAPDAAGLAPAARGRARARRRRTALTSVAAVVAVAGVVVGAALLGSRDGGETATPATDGATDSVSPDTPVANTRVESWRDISVTVPRAWGHGSPGDWCASGGRLDQPVVERPGGASVDILCDPEQGYGVQFMDGALADLVYSPGYIWQYEKGDVSIYPEGAWLSYQRASQDNLVWIVARDRETLEEILASFTTNDAVDPNGCGTQGAPGPAPADGSVRLCRYGLDGWLEQSEVLTGTDAAEAVAALESAPARDPDRMCTMEISGPTVQITSSDAEGSLTLNACQGFTWDGAAHELTADAIYWALSPGWSGGVDGDVPMPDKLRQ